MKTISYYELLEMVKEDNFPERIKVNVCNYPREYVAEYDGDDFCHYEIENKRLQDNNYKLFLGECFIESTMFDKCIEIIEEVEEKEIEKLPRDRKGFSVTYHYWSNAQQDQLIDNFSNIYSMANNNRDKINELIDVVNELKNKD